MQVLIPDRDYRIPSACGIAGIMRESGERFSGAAITEAMAVLRERTNGLGGGFAGYGIYPELRDYYAFHVIYDDSGAQPTMEGYLGDHFDLIHSEPIPTKRHPHIGVAPHLWRYFVQVKPGKLLAGETEDDYVASQVLDININARRLGGIIVSSGKNMGIFKGVGYPEDIAAFYRLDEYQGYIWTGHGRFPTNSAAWWGGAHPFGLLDWSLVHNGEISSYGANRRFLESYGYRCAFSTDSEVMTYLFDLLVRKQRLTPEEVACIMAPPFWEEIQRMPAEARRFFTKLRIVYDGALANGPFAIIVANNYHMIGLNDRIKLRPLVCGRSGDLLVVASEEAAIRAVCPQAESIWTPVGGEPAVGTLRQAVGLDGAGRDIGSVPEAFGVGGSGSAATKLPVASAQGSLVSCLGDNQTGYIRKTYGNGRGCWGQASTLEASWMETRGELDG